MNIRKLALSILAATTLLTTSAANAGGNHHGNWSFSINWHHGKPSYQIFIGPARHHVNRHYKHRQWRRTARQHHRNRHHRKHGHRHHHKHAHHHRHGGHNRYIKNHW